MASGFDAKHRPVRKSTLQPKCPRIFSSFACSGSSRTKQTTAVIERQNSSPKSSFCTTPCTDILDRVCESRQQKHHANSGHPREQWQDIYIVSTYMYAISGHFLVLSSMHQSPKGCSHKLAHFDARTKGQCGAVVLEIRNALLLLYQGVIVDVSCSTLASSRLVAAYDEHTIHLAHEGGEVGNDGYHASCLDDDSNQATPGIFSQDLLFYLVSQNRRCVCVCVTLYSNTGIYIAALYWDLETFNGGSFTYPVSGRPTGFSVL